jgi:hypothetical protein
MIKQPFARTLKRTRQELDRLRSQRARIDEEVAKLEQIEAALQAVAEPEAASVVDLSSLTSVIRRVVKSASVPITPPEVRDKMREIGFDEGPYSQFLASIHVVLKRLWRNGEIFEFTFKDKKTYWWVTKSMPAGSHPENVMLGKYYNTHRPEDLKTSKSHADSHYKPKS